MLFNDFNQDIYVDDLGSSFPNECVHFKSHIKNLKVDERPKNIQQMLVFIKNNDFSEMYPYIVIALRMLLCTLCSNCFTERSFLALKRVKSYLRLNIKEERLNALAILNIENDIIRFSRQIFWPTVFYPKYITADRILAENCSMLSLIDNYVPEPWFNFAGYG